MRALPGPSRPFVLSFAVLLLWPAIGQALPPGLVSKKSPYNVTQTLDRLESALKSKGCAIISRVDQRAIAKRGGDQIAPTEVLTFSCAAFDAAMLSSEQRFGLELPYRALAWQDSNGGVNLAYTSPDQLAQGYDITSQPVAVQQMSELLDQATDAAVQP